MFYSGDLQSGISKALQESKLVACFVTDESEESKTWEDEFLAESSIKDSMAEQTVLLRLVAGSQEAGYLAAIFPLPKTPTLVIIENGQLKEYITSGVNKEEFMRRLSTVLQSRVSTASAQRGSAIDSSTVESVTASTSSPNPESQTQTPSDPTATVSGSTPSSSGVQTLLAERSARLAQHKKNQEAAEKAKKAAEAATRKADLEGASAKPSSSQSADMKYALMQKKRQQEARDERARILKRVEDDRLERRDREARRKAEAEEKKRAESPGLAPMSNLKTPGSSARSKDCALQIRLFDGSTIRSRFPSQGSLTKDVRPWIDEAQKGDLPYTFKHVLTPLPNRNISISDEGQSLQSQGLTPSATLILVPVQGYTSAYQDGDASYLSRGLNAGYGIVSSGVGMVTGVLGSFLGGATQPHAQEVDTHPNPSTRSETTSNINVRTLRDQDNSEDHQLYNGNALNFEPRNDDKED